MDDALAQLRERVIDTVFPNALQPGACEARTRHPSLRCQRRAHQAARRPTRAGVRIAASAVRGACGRAVEREGSVELTKQIRDGSVDLYVVQHTLAGSLLTLVDVKRNARHRPIGVGVVRQLYGAVEGKKANAGLIATTSFFSPDAKRFQEELPFRLELKDYLDLQTMLRRAAGK